MEFIWSKSEWPGNGMHVVRWFVVALLWTAVVVGKENRARVAVGVSPVAMSSEAGTLPLVEGTRLCQTYRLKDGVASKVGKPHPCREKKRIQALSENLRGGATLPQ